MLPLRTMEEIGFASTIRSYYYVDAWAEGFCNAGFLVALEATEVDLSMCRRR